MKKSLLLLFFSVIALLGISTVANNLNVEAAAAGTVVFHYQKWDNNYDSVGLWVWGTGTGGASNGIEKTDVDDFGAYMEVAIGDDATSMGIIPIKANISTDDRWNNKDSKGGADLFLDVTAAAAGATMHVYFFSGSDTIFVADSEVANILVVYFTATELYEENLGIHAWGSDWVTDEAFGAWSSWGNPTDMFVGEFTTPGGKIGKVGMVQAAVGTDANFLVYAGSDATKKTADVANVNTDVVAGGVTAVYVAGDTYIGVDKAFQFAEESFAFKFIAMGGEDGLFTGTFASSKTSIIVKFSADVATAFYDELGEPVITEYQRYEIVGYEYIPTGTGGITIDETVYDPYAPAPLAEGLLGRVVFHYQKWDSDYSDVGIWTWSTGDGGSSSPVVKSGVDAFGAVMEINIGPNAGDSIGIIPLADNIGTDDRWASRETPDGQHINFDVTSIKSGAVDEIHVYYFQGGFQTYFIADPTKANVITLNYESSGTYGPNLGMYGWGSWTTATPNWTDKVAMYEAFKSPDSVPGMAVMNSFDPATEEDWIGYLVYDYVDASNEGKKTGDVNNANGTPFATMVAGDVCVIYTGFADKSFSLDHDRFVLELMVETERVAIYDYVTYEEESFPRVLLELDANFKLFKDGVEVVDPFESLDYNVEQDATPEFVIQLVDALVDGSVYTIVYDNGLEGIDEQAADIVVDMDDVAPVFTFISAQQVSIVAGEGWDTALWPNVRVTDDRDGNITNRVIVKEGEGELDQNTPGTYEIVLTASDTWGNVGEAVFTIVVTAPETGCAAQNASIAVLGLLGIAVFFARRKEWI